MSTIQSLWSRISDTILSSPRRPPSAVVIPAENVDIAEHLVQPFVPRRDYFQIRVNQLFLKADRKWLTEIDPVVFTVSDFLYNRQRHTVPCMVGPTLMQKFGQPVPHGVLVSNTRVAGLHPYKGDSVSLSVVLCQVPVNAPLRNLLATIERVAGVIDMGTALSSYVKLGGAILDAVDSLLGLDRVTPLVGLQTTFNPQAGDHFAPRFFALIDAPDIDPARLWVRDNTLLHGSSASGASPFRDADFVLYSIVRAPDNRRSDIEQLPFYEMWERVAAEAAGTKDDNWQNAKVIMANLYQAMVQSPDLTDDQADMLYDEFVGKMKRIHERALGTVTLGAQEEETPDPLGAARRKALDILKL